MFSESDRTMLNLNHITLSGTSRLRLDGVSLRIAGARTAVMGYSGAGKSSLLNVIAGFEAPDSGTVEQTGNRPGNIANSRVPMYWVPQNGGLWPHVTAEDHVRFVSNPGTTDKLLRLLDLEHRRLARPGELSQGERSRLALARALATRADLLLLDEPLSHVDPVRKPTYWNLLRQVVDEEGCAIVFASHEPETVLRHAEQVICLHEGRVMFQGLTTELYDSPPNRLAGELLGALNWFEPAEAARFLDCADAAKQVAVRPEFLQLEPVANSPIVISEMDSRGPCRQSMLRDRGSGKSRVIFHRPVEGLIAAGDSVRLRVMR